MSSPDKARMNSDAESDRLKQFAEVFYAITEVWLKHNGASESVKSDGQSKARPVDQLLELEFDQNKLPLISEMQQGTADLSTEEINRLRIQSAKAFLKEVDNKLAGETANWGQLKPE